MHARPSYVPSGCRRNPEHELRLAVKRGKDLAQVAITPELDMNGDGRLGVHLGSNVKYRHTKAESLPAAAGAASKALGRCFSQVVGGEQGPHMRGLAYFLQSEGMWGVSVGLLRTHAYLSGLEDPCGADTQRPHVTHVALMLGAFDHQPCASWVHGGSKGRLSYCCSCRVLGSRMPMEHACEASGSEAVVLEACPGAAAACCSPVRQLSLSACSCRTPFSVARAVLPCLA